MTTSEVHTCVSVTDSGDVLGSAFTLRCSCSYSSRPSFALVDGANEYAGHLVDVTIADIRREAVANGATRSDSPGLVRGGKWGFLGRGNVPRSDQTSPRPPAPRHLTQRPTGGTH